MKYMKLYFAVTITKHYHITNANQMYGLFTPSYLFNQFNYS